jgi:hypothetical protein
VPTCAGDSEEVVVCADVAEDVEGCVVLEEEIHFDADSADVLEHVGELHVFGVGAEAVEAVLVSFSFRRRLGIQNLHIMVIDLTNVRNLSK